MKQTKVLVVEDQADIRNAMREVLESVGYEVYEAADGQQGLHLLKSIMPEPCVVLLDLVMPKTSGWEFLDVQRSDPTLKSVPVVVCSGYVESARAVKPDRFIQKPIQLDDLLSTVHEFSA